MTKQKVEGRKIILSLSLLKHYNFRCCKELATFRDTRNVQSPGDLLVLCSKHKHAIKSCHIECKTFSMKSWLHLCYISEWLKAPELVTLIQQSLSLKNWRGTKVQVYLCVEFKWNVNASIEEIFCGSNTAVQNISKVIVSI